MFFNPEHRTPEFPVSLANRELCPKSHPAGLDQEAVPELKDGEVPGR